MSHGLVLDPQTARELVLAVVTMIPVEEDFSCEVRRTAQGASATVVVSRAEVRSVLRAG